MLLTTFWPNSHEPIKIDARKEFDPDPATIESAFVPDTLDAGYVLVKHDMLPIVVTPAADTVSAGTDALVWTLKGSNDPTPLAKSTAFDNVAPTIIVGFPEMCENLATSTEVFGD